MKAAVSAVFLALGALVPAVAQARLLWLADPDVAPSQVFKHVGQGNCEGGEISAFDDRHHGSGFAYHKPADSNRCESHGAVVEGEPLVFEEGEKYFLGWWSRLSSTANNNATFQWKSFGNHIQNFPIVLKMIDGQMSLMYTAPGGHSTIIWRRPIKAGAWHHYVLGIATSSDADQGTIEFWFDGEKQTIGGDDIYRARTFDSKNCPKWGVYGATGTAITNFIAEQRIGTSYADVAAQRR